jgi:hypothetical protein
MKRGLLKNEIVFDLSPHAIHLPFFTKKTNRVKLRGQPLFQKPIDKEECAKLVNSGGTFMYSEYYIETWGVALLTIFVIINGIFIFNVDIHSHQALLLMCLHAFTSLMLTNKVIMQ